MKQERQQPNLSILTNTIPSKKHWFLKTARFLKRVLLGKRPLVDRYGGHPAVTRSILEGLRHIGAIFNYNPSSESDLSSILFVLSDLDALRQGVYLKKRGLIRQLFAGPNLLIDPSDEKELLSSPLIDGFITPSGWVRDFYIHEIPGISKKCHVWPAGVNIKEWTPDQNFQKTKTALIYDKLDHGQPIHEYQEFLREQGWKTSIIRYGNYKKERYLQMLRQSQLALFFSPSESQGIALLECWSTDVPTLVWDRGWAFLKEKNKTIPASSAPYLNPDLGCFFSDVGSFKEVFLQWQSDRASFYPRQWVSTHMSDEVCAKNLLKIFGLAT